MISKATVAFLLATLASLAVPGISQASVFTITSTNFGVACPGVTGCGDVTVTESSSGVYLFDVDLSSALVLHSGQATIAFDLTGVTRIDPSSTNVTLVTGPLSMDGYGKFNFGADCSAQATGSFCTITGQSPSHDLIFSVDATAGQNLTNLGIALDVGNSACPSGTGCATGFAGVGSESSVPVPGALPLLASGLGAMGLLGWRRKRKMAALAA